MSIHDGLIDLDDKQVPVILGLEDETLRMSSGGKEIGEWAQGEYSITAIDDESFSIAAEDETLVFMPANPSAFAADLPGRQLETDPTAEAEAPPTRPLTEQVTEVTTDHPLTEETPPPRVTTLVAFYTLAAITAGLGLWALYSLLT